MKAILGRKMGMTSVFAEDGTMYPVTVVEVLPNVVTQVKTVEKDGYVAVQVGYEEKKESRANIAITLPPLTFRFLIAANPPQLAAVESPSSVPP